MDRKMQMDVDYDDEHYDEEHDYDAPAESDLQYSDEMSRQAVGKLFAGGGKNDIAGSPLVRGYRDGTAEKQSRPQARPQARPMRQVPAELDDSDDGQMDRARDIRVVERGRPRRESATTRITQPESQNDAYKSGARDAARAAVARAQGRPIEQAARQNAREAPESSGGGLNIEDPPKPRPARAAGAEGQVARPARQQAAQQDEGNLDYDGFRQRYNPGEMISPPRTKNRPVRGAQVPQRDVRKDRVKISDRDLETINSFRLVIVGSCILIVALIGFLGFRVAVLAGERNEALENVDLLAAAAAENINLRDQIEELRSDLVSAQNEASRYRGWLIQEGFELDGPVGEVFEGGGSSPSIGPGGTPPPRAPEVALQPVIPPGGYLEHLIDSGQSLASIAQIYWPHNPETPSGRQVRDQLIRHLADTNNIANPEIIFAGTWLQIFEHPHIAQPEEWR